MYYYSTVQYFLEGGYSLPKGDKLRSRYQHVYVLLSGMHNIVGRYKQSTSFKGT